MMYQETKIIRKPLNLLQFLLLVDCVKMISLIILHLDGFDLEEDIRIQFCIFCIGGGEGYIFSTASLNLSAVKIFLAGTTDPHSQ